MTDLVRGFWRWPRFPSVWDDDEDWGLATHAHSGISVSEDENHVYVDVAVPGVKPEDVEVTYDHNKGTLWIKGESKEEEKDKKKKYYRKASSSFSYRVAVPGEVDHKKEPQAECEDGVMKVTFVKSPKVQPKKIAVKSKK